MEIIGIIFGVFLIIMAHIVIKKNRNMNEQNKYTNEIIKDIPPNEIKIIYKDNILKLYNNKGEMKYLSDFIQMVKEETGIPFDWNFTWREDIFGFGHHYFYLFINNPKNRTKEYHTYEKNWLNDCKTIEDVLIKLKKWKTEWIQWYNNLPKNEINVVKI